MVFKLCAIRLVKLPPEKREEKVGCGYEGTVHVHVLVHTHTHINPNHSFSLTLSYTHCSLGDFLKLTKLITLTNNFVDCVCEFRVRHKKAYNRKMSTFRARNKTAVVISNVMPTDNSRISSKKYQTN